MAKSKVNAQREAASPPLRAGAGLLKKIRRICLALPESFEKEAWGHPTFRVRDRIFATFANNHHKDGRIAVVCKAGPGVQADLVGSDPERFFVPPYVGHKGWVGIHLDKGLDWDIVAELLTESYRLTAPDLLA